MNPKEQAPLQYRYNQCVDGLKVLRKGVEACKIVGKDVRTIIYFIRDRFPFVFEGEERPKSRTPGKHQG